MQVSAEVGLIQLTLIYIKNNNIEGLEKALAAMPLAQVESPEVLLNMFLSMAAANSRTQTIKPILEAFKVVFPDEDKMQILSRLFLIPLINLSTLAFVVLSHNDYTYLEALYDFIEYDSSPMAVVACNKADKIFGTQPFTTYEIIKDQAFQNNNEKVEEYAKAKMQEVGPFADVPPWVKNYNTDKPLPTESSLDQYAQENYTGIAQFSLPTDEEAVDLLTAGLDYYGISIAEIADTRQFLLEKLSTSTRMEKIAMIKPVMENQANKYLADETELFRIYGPANPLIGQDLTLPGNSNKYGGCRMFLCDVFDYNEEFDYVDYWFTGACQECDKRIRAYWHAVRKPRAHGGWEGCFCSWKCVRDYIIPDEPDLLTNVLINEFKDELETIGIQERTPKQLEEELANK